MSPNKEKMGSEKVALITGGAKRIGAKICQHLHECGWKVVIHSNQSATAASALAQSLNDIQPESAIAITADLSLTDNIATLAADTQSAFGQLDLLVNNASIFYPTDSSTDFSDQIDQLFGVNTKAPYLLIRALEEVLAGGDGGSVVNIIDIHGETPLRGYDLYSASKAALNMLTESLAIELAPSIRVNGVSPGAILWPEDAAEMSGDEKANLLTQIPMGRLGDPLDIAKAVQFLAEDAPFVTGQIIKVDGGQSV